MLDNIGAIIGLGIYSPKGIFIGNADNIVIDTKNRKADGIFVQSTNPTLVERGISVNIPFRWVQSIGDVIILKVFPDRVTLDPDDIKRSLPKQ